MTLRSLSRAAALTLVMGTASLVITPAAAQVAHTPITGQMVVTKAMLYDHDRYAKTGSNPKTGFSCIGFVWYVFQGLGIDMPGDLTDAMAAYPKIAETNLEPGDIIFFKNTVWKGVSHVGIYIGGGKMISAENFERGVNIAALRNDPVEGSYWQHHYLVAEQPLASIGGGAGRATGPEVTVSVPSLNLRTDHSLQSIVETVLPEGTVLRERGDWGAWLNVELKSGITGWVVTAGVSGVSTTSKPRRSAKTYAVLAGVNIHDGPALTDQVIAVTYPGVRVSILASRSGFTRVRTTSNVSGWVLSRFIEGAPTPRKRATPKRHKPAAQQGMLTITAHIRTGPSLDDRVIQWVPAGTRLVILGQVPLWDHVRVNSHLSGYIYADFIKA